MEVIYLINFNKYFKEAEKSSFFLQKNFFSKF